MRQQESTATLMEPAAAQPAGRAAGCSLVSLFSLLTADGFPGLPQVREGIQAVATRLKARGKAEVASTPRAPRAGRRHAGSAAEEEEEGETEAMEE